MRGLVFDIQRFSLHDGPGIRTTVFLKGCSLRCLWCHNPEGISPGAELRFRPSLCVRCGQCAAICDHHALSPTGKRMVRFSDCRACGQCAAACPARALTISGEWMLPRELLSQILRDAPFYRGEGGVTFSGGEPLLQAGFIAQTACLAKENWLSVAVDTCGNVPFSAFEALIPYTDVFLYDIKAASEALHRRGTGSSNQLLLKNLSLLDSRGARIWLRVPVIPSFNDSEEEMRAIADIAAGVRNAEKVTLIPYHGLGLQKYEEIGRECPAAPSASVKDAQMRKFRTIFLDRGLRVDPVSSDQTTPNAVQGGTR